jgi:hypothetical protein
MQKYKFVEGVDEAWMEYSDRPHERAVEAEATDLYLASEADAHIAMLLDQNTAALAAKDARIEQLEKALRKATLCDECGRPCYKLCANGNCGAL